MEGEAGRKPKHDARRFLRRTSLVPVVSDFLFDNPEIISELALVNSSHDVFIVLIDSAFAFELPPISAGWIETVGHRNGPHPHDVAPRAGRHGCPRSRTRRSGTLGARGRPRRRPTEPKRRTATSRLPNSWRNGDFESRVTQSLGAQVPEPTHAQEVHLARRRARGGHRLGLGTGAARRRERRGRADRVLLADGSHGGSRASSLHARAHVRRAETLSHDVVPDQSRLDPAFQLQPLEVVSGTQALTSAPRRAVTAHAHAVGIRRGHRQGSGRAGADVDLPRPDSRADGFGRRREPERQHILPADLHPLAGSPGSRSTFAMCRRRPSGRLPDDGSTPPCCGSSSSLALFARRSRGGLGTGRREPGGVKRIASRRVRHASDGAIRRRRTRVGRRAAPA